MPKKPGQPGVRCAFGTKNKPTLPLLDQRNAFAEDGILRPGRGWGITWAVAQK
jgi:hypothetical protein